MIICTSSSYRCVVYTIPVLQQTQLWRITRQVFLHLDFDISCTSSHGRWRRDECRHRGCSTYCTPNYLTNLRKEEFEVILMWSSFHWKTINLLDWMRRGYLTVLPFEWTLTFQLPPISSPWLMFFSPRSMDDRQPFSRLAHCTDGAYFTELMNWMSKLITIPVKIFRKLSLNERECNEAQISFAVVRFCIPLTLNSHKSDGVFEMLVRKVPS